MNKEKKWWRTRTLDQMNARLGKEITQKFIKARMKSEKVVRVLEIGFGEGRVLMELRLLFPQRKIELFGINNEREKSMAKQVDLINTAIQYDIASKQEAKKMILPKLYFYDVGRGLKFHSNFFDLIISQVSFQYIIRKDRLIEEIWRVLKLNGKAFLHIDSYEKNYPDFMQLNTETPRFLIYKNKRIIRLSKFIEQFRKKGFHIQVNRSKNKKFSYIILITKNTSRKLSLNLEFDPVSSIKIGRLKYSDEYKTDGAIWWGYRSVYNLK